MTTSTFVRLSIVSLVFLGAFVPLQTYAAEPPACLVAVVTKDTGKIFTEGSVSVPSGTSAYVLWVSTSGGFITDGNGKVIKQSGFVLTSVTTNSTYIFHVTAGGQTVTCSASLAVEAIVQGPTSIKVADVPLLSGGTVLAGMSIPVSYIQVTNTGKNATSLRGFQMTQQGNAPGLSVVGFSIIDDKGGSSGFTGGVVGSTPFVNGSATALADATLLPGQRKLFTIRASMASSLSGYSGTQLKLDVTGVETDATVSGTFPIRGTTWVLQ